MPDQHRGELAKTYVVANGASTADELIDYCKKHLACFKVPGSIVFLESLSRNAMGKLQLQELPNCNLL